LVQNQTEKEEEEEEEEEEKRRQKALTPLKSSLRQMPEVSAFHLRLLSENDEREVSAQSQRFENQRKGRLTV